MPKFVDHEKQKEKIAEAVWRIVARDGMEQVSVRNVAKEAGLSPGSMRHYFSTQSELIVFTMKFISEKIRKRAEGAVFSGDHMEDMAMLLEEALPLNDERRTETEVWFAFIAKAFTDRELAPHSAELYDEIKRGVTLIITGLMTLGLAKENLDPEIEIERLFALIDGLAIHGVIRPDECSPRKMSRVVRHHLQSLCK
ncbi:MULTISPECIES: TetR family transcriptional regulator C-terminal domain-containing protein [Bacillaceae]|uniref:TetR family transcriptional regulator C-terminal domain-containing protein n=1 Tax=Metabacillus sediminis TaxID=3117746 RepID=A0ABZ2NL35_9BACI|nr:TetR family transcriptional regulator C-terminal domain-containing protein [Bacillus sp. SJS]KZZ83117.1 TetR family transcriptional regulator [Bacillus sp. SJS]